MRGSLIPPPVVGRPGSKTGCKAKNPAVCKFHGIPQPVVKVDSHVYGVKDAIFRRSVLHTTVMANYRKQLPPEDKTHIGNLVAFRRQLDDFVEQVNFDELPEGDGDQAISGVLGILFSSSFLPEGDRVGFSNLEGDESDMERFSVMKDASRIATQWLDYSSTREAYALSMYTRDSKTYALEANSGNVSEQWKTLEEAVARSPQLTKPFVAYSRLNEWLRKDVIKQFDGGEITAADVGKEVTFNRVLSASANPAQVNGFSSIENPIVLEVETTHGAFLDATSTHPGEAEVLIPKGRYEIVNVMKNITYFWKADKKSGRKAETVLQIRFIADS